MCSVMRDPFKLPSLSVFDMSNPALRALVSDWKSEVRQINEAEARDFRTWWQAHVKETRYWGGGPDGGFADSGEYACAID